MSTETDWSGGAAVLFSGAFGPLVAVQEPLFSYAAMEELSAKITEGRPELRNDCPRAYP